MDINSDTVVEAILEAVKKETQLIIDLKDNKDNIPIDPAKQTIAIVQNKIISRLIAEALSELGLIDDLENVKTQINETVNDIVFSAILEAIPTDNPVNLN